jgi:hypothetical protein
MAGPTRGGGSARGIVVIIALLGPMASIGCAHPFQNRLPDAMVVPSRLVALPPLAAAYELDFFDKRTPKPEWAEAIGGRAAAELVRQTAFLGGFPLPVEKVNACGHSCLDLLGGLMRWGVIASMEIAAQMKGRANFRMYSVGDWRAKRDYAPLREAIGADFALFVIVRETYETGGRIAGSLIGGVHTYFKQVGVACVASLLDGRMIWCHADVDQWGDLREPRNTEMLVHSLLADLLPPRPP